MTLDTELPVEFLSSGNVRKSWCPSQVFSHYSLLPFFCSSAGEGSQRCLTGCPTTGAVGVPGDMEEQRKIRKVRSCTKCPQGQVNHGRNLKLANGAVHTHGERIPDVVLSPPSVLTATLRMKHIRKSRPVLLWPELQILVPFTFKGSPIGLILSLFWNVSFYTEKTVPYFVSLQLYVVRSIKGERVV